MQEVPHNTRTTLLNLQQSGESTAHLSRPISNGDQASNES
jgi:hypothetical protein